MKHLAEFLRSEEAGTRGGLVPGALAVAVLIGALVMPPLVALSNDWCNTCNISQGQCRWVHPAGEICYGDPSTCYDELWGNTEGEGCHWTGQWRCRSSPSQGCAEEQCLEYTRP
ncbi:MAG: hypothetical protein DRN95_06425 [Candidatus Hydrothermarchaeota archaeon]|nr:MAG: hypothetical protein DRN95_06425 [Candidatus Hydrothermarchaeota archaeon]